MSRNDAPTLADTLRAFFAAYSDGLRVALPAVVTAWDASTPGEASVRPTVRLVRRDAGGARLTFRAPILARCPVAWPGAGAYALTWPLAQGDTGMLVFADRSLDEWALGAGDDVDPAHPRRHAYADGVFVPGLRPFGELGSDQVDADALVVAGEAVYLGGSGLTAAQALAYATSVQAQLDTLRAAINAAAPVGGDGGAALKASLLAALGVSWPSVDGTTKTRAE